MKRILLASFLLVTPAVAQQPNPENTALGQEIMECVVGKVQLRTRIAQLEAELAKTKQAAKLPE